MCAALIGLQYAKCQYGQRLYTHDSTKLCSAQITTNTAGFVMAGHRAYSPISTSPDFVIDQVNPAGLFTGGFSKKYNIYDHIGCNSGVAVNNCQGVSIIETNDLGNGEAYALAGTHSQGMFFVTLDNAGNIIQTYRWDFQNIVSIPPTKPFIRESSTPGEYFICGEYNRESYVVRVNGATVPISPVWANWYAVGAWLDARALIESPYDPNELVVVGRTDIVPQSRTKADGFFMKLNSGNGAVMTFTSYNKQYDGDEIINCIEPAFSSGAGGQGYIVGGYSSHNITPSGPSNLNYSYWMSKLDPTGVILWSHLIEAPVPTKFPGSPDITDVFERDNPNSGEFEYYGIGESYYLPPGGVNSRPNLVVFKLDENGQNTFSPNEFHYTRGSAPSFPATSGYLTFKETGGGAGDGFQAYGTTGDFSTHYFVRAYFNGKSGCEEKDTLIVNIHKGPDSVDTAPVNVNVWNANCPTNSSIFYIVVNNISTNITTPCAAHSLPNGSNLRGVTGVDETNVNLSGIEILPNPTNGKLTIRGKLDDTEPIKVSIYNTVGQCVGTHELADQKEELWLSKFGLPDGIYYLKITSGQHDHSARIMYVKGD